MSRIRELAKRALRAVDAGLDRTDRVPRSLRLEPAIKTLRDRKRLRRAILTRWPRVFHAGRRGHLRRIDHAGQPTVQKRFSRSDEGRAALANELQAAALFSEYAWKVPILEELEDGFSMPLLDDDCLLANRARSLGEEARRRIACEAIGVAFDIFAHGYAHRDFHSRNMFLVDDRLLLVDFEFLTPVADARRIAFPESYDVVGRHAESPGDTRRMCYVHAHESSLERVLGIPLEVALGDFVSRIKDELRDASATFKGRSRSDRGLPRRHRCKSDRIYGSFELPHIEVRADEAQRDSARRLARFGVEESDLSGRTLLDLGCHVGAMSFAAQSMTPSRTLGIEFDEDKVAIAHRLARYNGLGNLDFRHGDVDRLTAAEIGEFDVTFCLAIESHVADPGHLFDLLGGVTANKLFFEGNSDTNVDRCEQALRRVGFAHVERRGFCDDDARPENNNRPLLVARKR